MPQCLGGLVRLARNITDDVRDLRLSNYFAGERDKCFFKLYAASSTEDKNTCELDSEANFHVLIDLYRLKRSGCASENRVP